MLKLISDIMIIFVAVEALFIMLLEMFGSTSKLAQKAFDLDLDYLNQPEAKVSMQNQGLYNGFIGLGILLVRFAFPVDAIYPGLLLFIVFVIIAALFGAITANKKIIFTQGLPAIISLILLLISHQ
ncbi:DUF1304 domain-containing protein [Lentilactobacillus laojiaonis]|uniref:DUF1304 domain-containing protein n=1 Tax=Lentilactobacillus laojiaonis TaxID=2883998 RepID=UPI001D0A6A7C|nr:DUF1304 domain-containing protein [Lentilactobacillus laojiaonis]UDM31994.1 DUF1304 domain-containing protein [Lentilactobacillus laojiaonis]